MKQTERNLRVILSKLTDDKLKMLAEGLEMSPFPILINKEYKKRFGRDDAHLKKLLKKQIRTKQIRTKQAEQKKLLQSLHVETKRLEQQFISISGLEQLSEKSIIQIHSRQRHLIENISKIVLELEKLHKHSIFLECDLLSNRPRKQA